MTETLGQNLATYRKKAGLSQETIAEKLGVTRQTISKWETNETTPDIYQAKRLASVYGVSLDSLISFDIEVKKLEEMVEKTTEETSAKVDWTNVWSKKYPILAQYSEVIDVSPYQIELENMLHQLETEEHLSRLDAFLVLKDILAKIWKSKD